MFRHTRSAFLGAFLLPAALDLSLPAAANVEFECHASTHFGGIGWYYCRDFGSNPEYRWISSAESALPSPP